MQIEVFQSDRSGRLVKAPAGHWAFVPNPLPPQLNAGILAEATGRVRNRIFVADGIIRAIDEDLPSAEG